MGGAVSAAHRRQLPLCHPVLGRDGRPRTAAPGTADEGDARRQHQDATGEAQPGDHRRCGRRTGRDQQAQGDHAEGVGHGDRGGHRQHVPWPGPAPARHRRRGHQGLAVARRERVQRAQGDGDEQGQSGEADGEVAPGHEVVQGPGPAVGTPGEDTGTRRRLPPRVRRERRATGPHPQRGRPGVGGGGQQVLGVGGQFPGHRLLRHVGRGECHAVAPRRDLPPAGPAGGARAPEAEGDGARAGQRGGQPALHAQGVEAGLAGTSARAAAGGREGGRTPVDPEGAVGGGPRAPLPGPRAQPQPLDVGLGLGRRDLGEVLHMVDAELSGSCDQAVVAVDGEVAEGVGAGGARREQGQGAHGDQDAQQTRCHSARTRSGRAWTRCHSAPSSASRARAAPSGEKPGFSARAEASEARPAARWPVASSITPRW